MNIAIVTINQENAAIASWLAAQDFSGCTLAHWQIEPQPVVAEQVLDALVEQWQRTPADVVLFPPGTFGDELSTRLAWRLHGASICQVTSLDIPTVSVRKSHWGNALTATLQTEKRPLCLSLARQAGAAKNATLPSGMQQLNIVPGALPDWLVSTEDLKNVTRDPLAEARTVGRIIRQHVIGNLRECLSPVPPAPLSSHQPRQHLPVKIPQRWRHD